MRCPDHDVDPSVTLLDVHNCPHHHAFLPGAVARSDYGLQCFYRTDEAVRGAPQR